MKNITKTIIISSLFLLVSCGSTTNNQETVEIPTDVNPDVTALFVQACKNKDSQCKQLLCSKVDGKFNCSENPLAENTTCSIEKSYDDIVTSYKMCGEDDTLHTYQIFNYSEKKNDFFTSMTPAELESKITEETKIIEEGGSSEWMGTFLASAGGALLGGIIANQIFGGSSAQVPQRANNTENNRSVNKASFSETKEQSKTQTQTRTEKRKADFQKKVDSAKKKINSTKKTTPTKKSSSRRRR